MPKPERRNLSPLGRAALKLLREQFQERAKRDALSRHEAPELALAFALLGDRFQKGRALGSATKLKNSIEVKQTLIALAQALRAYKPHLCCSANQAAKEIRLALEKIRRDSPEIWRGPHGRRKQTISVRAIRRHIASLF